MQTACRGLGYEPELGTYLSSMIPVDRGFVRSLSQCYYGDEEKDYKPIPQFVTEMNNRPDIWNVAKNIEGLISRRGKLMPPLIEILLKKSVNARKSGVAKAANGET